MKTLLLSVLAGFFLFALLALVLHLRNSIYSSEFTNIKDAEEKIASRGLSCVLLHEDSHAILVVSERPMSPQDAFKSSLRAHQPGIVIVIQGQTICDDERTCRRFGALTAHGDSHILDKISGY